MFNIEPSRVLPETALMVFRFKLLIYLGALRKKKKKKGPGTGYSRVLG